MKKKYKKTKKILMTDILIRIHKKLLSALKSK